jgi:D-arabinose 1-dehydrogenase-like Zn-dependent alcohol dehydrogenase
MRAFVVDANGGASLRDVPRPVPGHDEALVRVTTASICATGLKILDGPWGSKTLSRRFPGWTSPLR